MTIKFNISPSALNLYKISPLIFYFKYITKSKPDTKVFTCYGNAGSIVHECVERYCKGKKDLEKYFFDQWDKKNLDVDSGFGCNILSKEDYFAMAAKAILLVKDNYDIRSVEEMIEIPYMNNSKFVINIKGIIDFFGQDKDNNIIIVDWKTGSSSSDFEMHSKHYAYLILRKHGILIDKVVIHYLKEDKVKEYSFTREELLEYEEEMKKIVEDIIVKEDDISQYEVGNIDWIFNDYKDQCVIEYQKRGNVI